MAKSFTTFISRRNNCLWIVLPDSIDMDNYLQIEERIIPELEQKPMPVVLDFMRTTALFSSGIGLVVRLQKRLENLGLSISLVNVEQKIQEGLENVGLDKSFGIFATEQAFLAAQNTARA